MNIVDKLAGLVLYNTYLLAVLLVCLRSMWRRSRLRGAVAAAERGQGLVEYALILVLVAVVVIGVLLVLGPSIKDLF